MVAANEHRTHVRRDLAVNNNDIHMAITAIEKHEDFHDHAAELELRTSHVAETHHAELQGVRSRVADLEEQLHFSIEEVKQKQQEIEQQRRIYQDANKILLSQGQENEFDKIVKNEEEKKVELSASEIADLSAFAVNCTQDDFSPVPVSTTHLHSHSPDFNHKPHHPPVSNFNSDTPSSAKIEPEGVSKQEPQHPAAQFTPEMREQAREYAHSQNIIAAGDENSPLDVLVRYFKEDGSGAYHTLTRRNWFN
jgi:hypothetical protein